MLSIRSKSHCTHPITIIYFIDMYVAIVQKISMIVNVKSITNMHNYVKLVIHGMTLQKSIAVKHYERLPML